MSETLIVWMLDLPAPLACQTALFNNAAKSPARFLSPQVQHRQRFVVHP